MHTPCPAWPPSHHAPARLLACHRRPQVSPAESTAYMCELYARCQETRKKTLGELEAKYLQPLGRPRK